MVVVALVSAVVAMTWSGVHHAAVHNAAIERLRSLDQHMRTHARTHRYVCALSFELGSSKVQKLYHNQAVKNPPPDFIGRSVRLSGIESVIVDATGKQVDVSYGSDGSSPTFAVELSGPGDITTWLLFAGISGQMTQWEKASDLDALWKSLGDNRL